ncbi:MULTISPECIES: hypothetical protein [unclassified Vibrio]|uniref:hypothetical protein n=1 Tax=unclassified Vibrio TaxID=2614977 RepID=UPI000068E53F|nr:hypothetical protein [Vibrio sp. MED222]EAQ54302.1 hypothetical protein MED222_14430 [Vibrio sp. MED222]
MEPSKNTHLTSPKANFIVIALFGFLLSGNAFSCTNPADELEPILERDFLIIESEFNRRVKESANRTNRNLAALEAKLLDDTRIDMERFIPKVSL